MDTLKDKQQAYNSAMKRYEDYGYYQYLYKIVSSLNVSLQFLLFILAFYLDISFTAFVCAFFIAYFLADFINGLVHMYMDNNAAYTSVWGPFIAAFHLHHQKEKYKNAPLYKIYFNESGAKFWLVPYLLIVLILYFLAINSFILLILIFIGILSSVAEVSHYLCHNSSSKIVHFLQKIRILLPISHHQNHHLKDNVSYAFLNGTSDFIIDAIAKRVYKGYQEHTDLHAKMYQGKGTSNR